MRTGACIFLDAAPGCGPAGAETVELAADEGLLVACYVDADGDGKFTPPRLQK